MATHMEDTVNVLTSVAGPDVKRPNMALLLYMPSTHGKLVKFSREEISKVGKAAGVVRSPL